MDRRNSPSRERLRFRSFVFGAVMVGAVLVAVMAMQVSDRMRHGVVGWLISVDSPPGPRVTFIRRALVELDDSEDGFRVVHWGDGTMPDVEFEPKDPIYGVHHVGFGTARGARGIWARTATLSGHGVAIWNPALYPRIDSLDLELDSDTLRRRMREVVLERVDREQGTSFGSDRQLIETGKSLRSKIFWWGWVMNAATIAGFVAMVWGTPAAIQRMNRIVARVSGGGETPVAMDAGVGIDGASLRTEMRGEAGL